MLVTLDLAKRTTMTLKTRQSLIALSLGLGFVLGTLGMLITFGPKGGISDLPVAHAAGPLYVATTGSDQGNDCIDRANPCASVQHAVDVAKPGDEILVATGAFTGVNARPRNDVLATGLVTQLVYISKTVTMRGGYSTDFSAWDPIANPTILDAQGQGRVIYITGNISPTLEGLHITNGDGTNLKGGVVLDGNAGGGLYAISATLFLRHDHVSNNTVVGSQSGGGGVYVAYGVAMVSDSAIVSNTSEAGGGLAFVISDALLRNNQIISNTAQLEAGGLGFGSGSHVTIIDTMIMSNTAQAGGGVYATYGATADLNSSIVQGNRAVGGSSSDGGGGIWVGAISSIAMTNSVVRDNQAAKASPGIVIRISDARLWHTTIAGNVGGSGSGLELSSGTAALTNTILVSHAVGISVTASSSVTLNGILWFDNGANTGGAGAFSVTNAYTANPDFAADGFHLTSASAAIDKGVYAEVTTDIDGEPRLGHTPDLGADEYWLPGALRRLYLPLILRLFK
jgi:hypothetical protein